MARTPWGDVELARAPFIDGPAQGEEADVPADPIYDDLPIWRFVKDVGFCLYHKDSEGCLRFHGKVLNFEEMMAWMAQNHTQGKVWVREDRHGFDQFA